MLENKVTLKIGLSTLVKSNNVSRRGWSMDGHAHVNLTDDVPSMTSISSLHSSLP